VLLDTTGATPGVCPRRDSIGILNDSPMHGVILIDKPAGAGSADVVRQIKRRVKPDRVGHLGTLDPFATGLLPILIGEATKLAPFLQDSEKEYEGIVRLGLETDTLDPTGAVVHEAPVPPFDSSALDDVAHRFLGEIEQSPPVFSAIKRAGVPLYRLARQGVEVEPPAPRRVVISRLTLESAGPDSLRLTVVCSTGTYVRALARDIGAALGTAAHLAELRRIRTAGFSVADTHPLDEALAALAAGRAESIMIGLNAALPAIPSAIVGDRELVRLRNGDSRALDGIVPAGARLFKVIHNGALIAIAEASSRVTANLIRVFG